MAIARKRSRLGENPLDALIPARGAQPRMPAKTSTGAKPPRASAPVGGRTTKQTFNVDPKLLEEMRAAVVACAGPPWRLTMASLLDRALRAEIERLRKQANDGQPFDAVGEPRRGRPLGT